MSDDELNRRLAELHLGYDPKGEHWQVCRDGIPRSPLTLPDFCADLNETAKVEAGLKPHQWSDYTMTLRRIIQRDCNTPEHYVPGCDRIADFWFYCANARQRTIALIQTLQP